jgi:hypothetical protein
MPARRLRQNRLPVAPPPLRHRVHSPGSTSRESSLERVRRISREHRASERPFDPEKRGSWQGSSRDLVVNSRRKHRKNPVGNLSADELLEVGVQATLDTALSDDHYKSDIVGGAVLVGWDRGQYEDVLVIAVIGATQDTEGNRDLPTEEEAIEIATDYAVEKRWFRAPRAPEYVAVIEAKDQSKRERFEGLQQGSFYRITGSSYGDVSRDKDGEWWGSDYTQGSDYSGGTVTLSNYNQLFEMAKESGVDCCETVSGGHGTYAIFFNVYTTPDEIVEVLAGLDEYPSVDDEALSELEMEQSNEAWEDWGKSEFRKALEKKFGGDADEVSDEDLYTCFHEASEASNSYWEDQQGSGMWIDMNRVVKAVDEPPPGFIEA